MKKLFAFIALGLLCAESQSSIISTNQVNGLNNIIHYGQYNKISGNDNQVFGHENRIKGQNNAALGLNNQLMGAGNLVAGFGNTISGKNNFVGGVGNIVVGSDASEEEKALISQKMMSMFASRGFNGVPGLAVASNQSSAVISNSKDNKNTNLQPQALQTLSDPEPQQSQPLRVDTLKKTQQVKIKPVISDGVEKKEEKVFLQSGVKEKNPTQTPEAYLVQTKVNQYDYNRADNAEAMPVEDLTFFDDSKSKTKDNKPNLQNSSPTAQPLNTVVQSVSQAQQESRIVVTSVPVKPVQVKPEVLVQPEVMVVKPAVKPVEVEPVEVELVEVEPVEVMPVEVMPVEVMPVEVMPVEVIPVEVMPVQVMPVETPKPAPVVQQQNIPVVAQQNKIEAQQNQIQAQQNRQTTLRVDGPKQDVGFKFYVNDGSTTDSSSPTSTQPTSRYSRTARTFDQVPEVVTVPRVRSSNLRQQSPPKSEVPKQVESVSSPSNSFDGFRVIQSSSSVEDSKQTVSPVISSSSTVGSVNVVSSGSSANRGVSSQNTGFSSSSENSRNSPSSNAGRYRRESTEVLVQAPVVLGTTTTVVSSNSPSTSISTNSTPKTANDVASSYISSGNPNVVILSGESGLGGPSGSAKQASQVPRDHFRK